MERSTERPPRSQWYVDHTGCHAPENSLLHPIEIDVSIEGSYRRLYRLGKYVCDRRFHKLSFPTVNIRAEYFPTVLEPKVLEESAYSISGKFRSAYI